MIFQKLWDILNIQSWFAFKSKYFSDKEGFPLIRIRDIARWETKTYYTGEFSEEYVVKRWDFLIWMDWEFKCYEWQWYKALLNQRVCRIQTKDEKIDIRYVYYGINKFLKEIEDKTPFVTVKHISINSIRNINFPLPPLPEQQAIAQKLDRLQQLIDLKKQAIAKTDELAKSMFLEMFGDPMTNEKGWEVKLLYSVSDVRDGTHDSPRYHSNWYPLITSKNIKDGDIDFTNINLISKEDYDKINKRSKVDDWDILMPMIWTIWNPIIVNKDRDFAIKNVALIKFNSDQIINIYLLYLLKSHYFDFLVWSNRGWTQKFIALSDIRNFNIPLPSLSLQQHFADIITKIEKQKTNHKQALAKLEELYQSEMQRSFSR